MLICNSSRESYTFFLKIVPFLGAKYTSEERCGINREEEMRRENGPYKISSQIYGN